VTAAFLAHFLHFFYAPPGQPWYQGNVWGNVVAVSILVPGGYVWSKTRFWPLRPIRSSLARLHEKHDATAERVNQVHARLDAHEELHAEHADKLDRLLRHAERGATDHPPLP
jgi:hypothetical protein